MVFQFVQINDPVKRLITDTEQHTHGLGVGIEQDTAADKLVCAEGHSVDLFSHLIKQFLIQAQACGQEFT
jgi:hypothetical protein